MELECCEAGIRVLSCWSSRELCRTFKKKAMFFFLRNLLKSRPKQTPEEIERERIERLIDQATRLISKAKAGVDAYIDAYADDTSDSKLLRKQLEEASRQLEVASHQLEVTAIHAYDWRFDPQ